MSGEGEDARRKRLLGSARLSYELLVAGEGKRAGHIVYESAELAVEYALLYPALSPAEVALWIVRLFAGHEDWPVEGGG